jgi:hypothetical protein
MKPIYKVSIERCIDGKSIVADVAYLGHYANIPGRWLSRRAAA